MSRLSSAVVISLVWLFFHMGIVEAQETRRYIAPRTAADTGVPPFSGAV